MNNELWRDVVGYEGLYMVSSLGRIKSLPKPVRRGRSSVVVLKERILSPAIFAKGYLRVQLGRAKGGLVHRFVLESFIPNPDNKPCVNHINGDKLDNRVANLEWATYAENNTHSYRKLGKASPMKGRFGSRSPFSKPLLQFKDGALVGEYDSTVEAAIVINGSDSAISACCRGKTKSSYGYIWRYKQ